MHDGGLRRMPLYEQAYGALRDMIVSGRLRAGQTVTEVALAKHLGVSRTPVREACKTLLQQGLLVSTPSGATTVVAPTVEDVAEVYLVRATLEGLSAALTAQTRDGERLDMIDEAARSCLAAAADGDVEASMAANVVFHRYILEGSGHLRAMQLMDQIEPLVARYAQMAVRLSENVLRSAEEHLRLLPSLRAGDAGEAERIMRDHILRAGARTIRTFEIFENVLLDLDSPTARSFQPYLEAAATEGFSAKR